MFTGIIAAIGEIKIVTPIRNNTDDKNQDLFGIEVLIHADNLDLKDVMPGDSLAVQGVCLTAIAINPPYFTAQISKASLSVTYGLDRPGKVNLEKALTLSSRINGHLSTGHIDGAGVVQEFAKQGESYLLRIIIPNDLAKYVAYKGSILINGVSLTVNEISNNRSTTDKDAILTKNDSTCSVNLIDYTLQHTTLQFLKIGDLVNLEVDLIARYVENNLNIRFGV